MKAEFTTEQREQLAGLLNEHHKHVAWARESEAALHQWAKDAYAINEEQVQQIKTLTARLDAVHPEGDAHAPMGNLIVGCLTLVLVLFLVGFFLSAPWRYAHRQRMEQLKQEREREMMKAGAA